MLTFMCATYNEERQINNLLESAAPYVDAFAICDDGSTDSTVSILQVWKDLSTQPFEVKVIDHTGLPETVKGKALSLVNTEWVVMLDCDERIPDEVWEAIKDFCSQPQTVTHVWFTLHEYIDGVYQKTFQKCRLFKAKSAHFSTTVHTDDWFDGEGAFFEWVVIHDKSSRKQRIREREYIDTYKNLVAQGQMTPERMREVIGFHYFIKE